MYKNIFLFALILLAGFFALKDSFTLSLFGDDWLAFWRYNYHLGSQSLNEFNHLSYFLTVYGPQDVIMGLLEKIFGMNSLAYFIISFLFRMLAAFSLFPLVYYLTKSRLAGFVASLFFAASFIGIETTNWVFNMPSYLGIAFLNLFFYFFLLSRDSKNKQKVFISLLFFYLAFVSAPIRMTGLPLMIILLEGYWFLQDKSLTRLKQIIFRLLLITFTFLLIKYGGQSLGITSDHLERLLYGISEITKTIQHGNLAIILNPFITLGGLFIPEIIWKKASLVQTGRFLSLYFPLLATFTVLTFIINKSLLLNIFSRFFISSISLATLWTLAIRFISKQTLTTFSDPFQISAALIGGFFLIILIQLFMRFWKTQKGTLFFLSFIIIVLSFLLPWLFAPSSAFVTSHRYLILTGIGLSIFWASLLSVSSNKGYLLIITIVISLFTSMHIYANQMYFMSLNITRGNGINGRIWTQLTKELPNIHQTTPPLIFYFEGTPTNSDTINDVITFGFPPHIAFMYDIYHDHDRIPIPITNYNELKDIVITGNTLPAYGRKKEPLPLTHIYAFKLEGRNKLINITKQTRDSLAKLKEIKQ